MSKATSENVEYRDALITYLDILGFGDMVQKSDSDPSQAEVIRNLLSSLQEGTNWGSSERSERDETGQKIQLFFADNFSDTIIRTTFIGRTDPLHEYIRSEIWRLAKCQYEQLSKKGILLRGGIARGKLYRHPEGKFIFGPALVRAYHLAEHVAIYPRIVVDHDLVEILERHKEYWPGRWADDGVWFVDYLHDMRDGFAYAVSVVEKRAFFEHKILAERKLEELGKRGDHLRQKALWLALYHNTTILRILSNDPVDDGFESLMIEKEKMLG